MSKRSEEWLFQFEYLLPEDEETRSLVLCGDIEVCPGCCELSAYAYRYTTAYDQFEDNIIPGGFKPEAGTIAHIGTCGSWEWECGHCRTRWMDRDSPLNHPAYTHGDDDDA